MFPLLLVCAPLFLVIVMSIWFMYYKCTLVVILDILIFSFLHLLYCDFRSCNLVVCATDFDVGSFMYTGRNKYSYFFLQMLADCNHERGNVAWSSRQTRIQEKETRKTQIENRYFNFL